MIARRLLYLHVDSPIGELVLLGDGRALRGLHMQQGRKPMSIDSSWQPNTDSFENACEQLAEYFAGRRISFDVQLAMKAPPFGTPRVWRALEDIDYGERISYGELARRIDRPSAARAVGMANGRGGTASR